MRAWSPWGAAAGEGGNCAQQLGPRALQALGQPREAERMLRRSVQIGSADAAGTSVSPMLLNQSGPPGAGAGPASMKRSRHRRTRRRRSPATAGDEVVLHAGDAAPARRAYRERGDLARAGAIGWRSSSGAEGTRPAAGSRGVLRRWPPSRRCSTRRAGDLGAAATSADRAVAIAEASTQGRELLARGLLRRANLALVQGRAAAAVTDAERGLALELSRGEAGSLSSVVGRAHLTMGRAFHAAERNAEARASLTQAVRHLDSSVGEDHADTRRARDLLAALE